METPLHSQKLAILSRLIKESSLTLEEALLLLKDEEIKQEVDNQPFKINTGTTTPWTIPSWQTIGTPNSGTITISNPAYSGGVAYFSSTGNPLNLTGSVTTSTNNTILEDASL